MDSWATTHRHHAVVAASAAVVALFVVTAALTGWLPGTAAIVELDRRAHDWIIERRTPWATTAMGYVTHVAEWTTVAVLTSLVALAALARRRVYDAALVVLATAGAAIVSDATKALVDRARPELIDRLVGAPGGAFPSGHSIQSVACYGAIALVLLRWHPHRPGLRAVIPVVAVVALTVGFSRVYLGVHWVTDVVAGWIIAAAWVALIWAAVAALETRRRRTLPSGLSPAESSH